MISDELSAASVLAIALKARITEKARRKRRMKKKEEKYFKATRFDPNNFPPVQQQTRLAGEMFKAVSAGRISDRSGTSVDQFAASAQVSVEHEV